MSFIQLSLISKIINNIYIALNIIFYYRMTRSLVFIVQYKIIDYNFYQNYYFFFTVISIFWAVFVFGIMCWSRDWLLNPNFNYLSWSYAFAVISGGIHAFAGLMMLHVRFYLMLLLRYQNFNNFFKIFISLYLFIPQILSET